MIEFLRKLFAGATKSGPQARSARLRLESFESRDLPNAGPLFSAFSPLALGNQAHVGAASPEATHSMGQCQSQGQTQTLTATLTGSTGTSGSVTFRLNTTTGDNSLNVQVAGLTADSTYTVTSGTTTLGTITTNANGQGQLFVSDLSPALTAGANITVLDTTNTTVLSGTLAAATYPTDTLLSASLSGATGTTGSAYFNANATSGQNRLSVWVSGLAADTTYTVEVDTTTVGQIVTNNNGSGRLLATNLSNTVAAGSTVTVLNASGTTVLQGTFAADTSFARGGHHV